MENMCPRHYNNCNSEEPAKSTRKRQQQERQCVTRKAVRSKRVRTNGLCEWRRGGEERGNLRSAGLAMAADGTGREAGIRGGYLRNSKSTSRLPKVMYHISK